MKVVMSPRQFIGWGLLVLLIFILCWRECTRPNLSLGIDHSLRDSAILLTERIESQRLNDSARLTDSIFKIQTEKGQADLRVNQLSTQLDNSISYSKYLLSQLKDAKDLIEDTGMISVSPKYIDYCDTCADQLLKQSALVVGYKAEVQDRERIHSKELAFKDSAIAVEKRSNIAERYAFQLMNKGYNDLAAKFAPRNQVYAGIVAQGNEITFIQGVGLGATLITKQGKLWGADVLMIRSGDLLFQGRAQFKISFRNKK